MLLRRYWNHLIHLKLWLFNLQFQLFISNSNFLVDFQTLPNCTFIRVFENIPPTCLFGPTRLLNIKALSIQHVYLDYTFIRNTRVHTWFKQFVERFWSFFVRFQSLWINWFQVGFWTTESRIMPTESARSSILKRKLMLPEMFYRISGDYLL